MEDVASRNVSVKHLTRIGHYVAGGGKGERERRLNEVTLEWWDCVTPRATKRKGYLPATSLAEGEVLQGASSVEETEWILTKRMTD